MNNVRKTTAKYSRIMATSIEGGHFENGNNGEWVDDPVADLNTAIRECERIIKESKAMLAKIKRGDVADGDTYLSFESVLDNGYDRTGPNEVSFVLDDE